MKNIYFYVHPFPAQSTHSLYLCQGSDRNLSVHWRELSRREKLEGKLGGNVSEAKCRSPLNLVKVIFSRLDVDIVAMLLKLFNKNMIFS